MDVDVADEENWVDVRHYTVKYVRQLGEKRRRHQPSAIKEHDDTRRQDAKQLKRVEFHADVDHRQTNTTSRDDRNAAVVHRQAVNAAATAAAAADDDDDDDKLRRRNQGCKGVAAPPRRQNFNAFLRRWLNLVQGHPRGRPKIIFIQFLEIRNLRAVDTLSLTRLRHVREDDDTRHHQPVRFNDTKDVSMSLHTYLSRMCWFSVYLVAHNTQLSLIHI